jgi:chaperone required for assembly of F1-ATPase
MQRFWRQASVYTIAGNYGLQLDDVPRLTPANHEYLCPTAALAAALAQEWQDAPEKFNPRHMPLTQLVATTHDMVAPKRAAIIAGLLGYAHSDMLCFWAAEPAALAARQTEIWQPYLTWAADHYGIVFVPTHNLQPPTPSPAPLATLQAIITALSNHQLTALHQISDLTSSVLLGLALITGWRTGAAIYQAAELDALYQAEHWGADDEATHRQHSIQKDILDCERFVTLLEQAAI